MVVTFPKTADRGWMDTYSNYLSKIENCKTIDWTGTGITYLNGAKAQGSLEYVKATIGGMTVVAFRGNISWPPLNAGDQTGAVDFMKVPAGLFPSGKHTTTTHLLPGWGGQQPFQVELGTDNQTFNVKYENSKTFAGGYGFFDLLYIYL